MFHKPLILIHQRAGKNENHNQENRLNWSHGPQPCLWGTQWNYEPCCVGPCKKYGSWWRILTECGPLEKGIANHFRILALRTPWALQKGKKIGHWKMNSPGLGAQYATGDQWRNNSRQNEETQPKQKQHPIVDVTGDGSNSVVKSNIA